MGNTGSGMAPAPASTGVGAERRDVMKEFDQLQAELALSRKQTQGALSIPQNSAIPRDDVPAVEDPIVERLLREARSARMKGDMRLAMVKLEEASSRTKKEKKEVAVIYEQALVYEAMGVFDLALDHYHQVYELGSQQAMGLYSLAAQKLSDGFQENNNLLALGRVREFRDERVPGVQKIILTVPVVAAIAEDVDPTEVQVEVNLYDKLNGKVVLPDSSQAPQFKWVSQPVDWKGAKEELLQVTYVIEADQSGDDYLFGERKYYGHVAELSYRGEVIDQQAWPRLLAREKNIRERDPLMMPDGYLPNDFNHENPLLPTLNY